MLSQMIDYFQDNMGSYLLALGEHIGISFLALFIAALIGIPGGFLCVRYRRTQKWIMPLSQVLRIIPSLAVLFLLIPVMGTGIWPALTALTALAVPPVLLNTAAGLEEVPEFMIETAMSCGMTPGQTWKRVRFPLAMPMILTGLKTAMTEIIASATLAAKIGAGGLGGIIFTGLGLYRFDLLLIGGGTVALLSLLAGVFWGLAGRVMLHYKYL